MWQKSSHEKNVTIFTSLFVHLCFLSTQIRYYLFATKKLDFTAPPFKFSKASAAYLHIVRTVRTEIPVRCVIYFTRGERVQNIRMKTSYPTRVACVPGLWTRLGVPRANYHNMQMCTRGAARSNLSWFLGSRYALLWVFIWGASSESTFIHAWRRRRRRRW